MTPEGEGMSRLKGAATGQTEEGHHNLTSGITCCGWISFTLEFLRIRIAACCSAEARGFVENSDVISRRGNHYLGYCSRVVRGQT
jgi:hypothetical protein